MKTPGEGRTLEQEVRDIRRVVGSVVLSLVDELGVRRVQELIDRLDGRIEEDDEP